MNRGQLVIGLFLIVLGVMFLLGTVFQIDAWAICWPVGLILVGAWLLLRPRLVAQGTLTETVLLGDLRKRGRWQVREGEFWLGIADIDMDFTEAEIPPGETRLKFYGFVGDIDLYVPKTIGIAVNAGGFVVDSDLFGRDRDSILTPVEATSENYASAECKLRVDFVAFVTNIKVKQI